MYNTSQEVMGHNTAQEVKGQAQDVTRSKGQAEHGTRGNG